MNWVVEYNNKIQSYDILACQTVKAVYARMVKQMTEPDFPYYFDEKKGQYVIDFIEKFCRHYQGEKAGQPVRLELFQKAFVQNLFGWLRKDNKLRRFREYFFEVPRKHGKSFLSGCIGDYMLVADGEQGAEVYSAATKLDQAKIIYNVAKAIVEQSPELRALVNSTREGLSFKLTRSIFKPLPSESKTLDGLNIHYAALDEIHEQKDRNMYDVLRQGMKARRQPLLGSITTAGFRREGLYDNLHDYAVDVALGNIVDEEFFALVYMLDSLDEWMDEPMWIKANPGLDTIKSRDQLRADVERAKHDPSYLPTLLTKDFNMKQSEAAAWLSLEDIINETTVPIEKLQKSYAIGGCDLSSVYDLTCGTLLIRKPNDENVYVLQHYFVPQSKIDMLEKTASKEAPYKLWAEQGWLTICEGAAVNYHDVTMWFVERVKKDNIRPLYICYDRALSGYWVPEMEGYGFEMVKIPQGAYTWSQPMKEMGAAFSEHKVVYQNNPILRWCLSNTAKKSMNADGIESIMPVKIQQRRRIDGTVSLLNAWVGYVKKFDDYMPYIK